MIRLTEPKYPTNEALACAYFAYRANSLDSLWNAQHMKERIKHATASIPDFYKENGNLWDLAVKGISVQTKALLEHILSGEGENVIQGRNLDVAVSQPFGSPPSFGLRSSSPKMIDKEYLS